MEREDARKLSSAEQLERRRQAIRAHRRGRSRRQIADEVGLSYTAVVNTIKRCESQGMAGLASGKRGRPFGSSRKLTEEQERRVRTLIQEHRPEQLKMDFALWTRAAVMLLIERECDVRMIVRTVGKLPKRWGFTPQKPIRRAYEQNPVAIRKWLDEIYPAIAERAKDEGAEIHWGDETALVNTDVRGRGFAPRGQTPIARVVGGTRQKLSMISTVTNQGKTCWEIIDGNFNHERLIDFLKALVKQAGRKVFLVLDNLGVHHCKPVKQWLAEHLVEIEVFHLPSYSPELNPDERLNASLKHAIAAKVPMRTKAKLKTAAEQHMHELQQAPERVAAFFRDPRVAYAA